MDEYEPEMSLIIVITFTIVRSQHKIFCDRATDIANVSELTVERWSTAYKEGIL